MFQKYIKSMSIAPKKPFWFFISRGADYTGLYRYVLFFLHVSSHAFKYKTQNTHQTTCNKHRLKWITQDFMTQACFMHEKCLFKHSSFSLEYIYKIACIERWCMKDKLLNLIIAIDLIKIRILKWYVIIKKG